METTVLTRLAEITAYSAAIFLAVLLFRFAFSRQLSPSLKYVLWLIVLLRLTVPVTFESAFHLITLPEPTAAPLRPAVTASPATPVPVLPAEQAPAETPLPRPSATAEITPYTPPRRTWRPDYKQVLLLIWAAGVVTVAAVEIGLGVRLARHIRARGVAADAATTALFEGVKTRLGVKPRIRLLLIDDIQSPALTVQLRPKLLLPDGLVDRRSREEQMLSMSHELMHYKRRDHLVLLLLSVLRALYWFNPVVWLIVRFLRTDMESACDAQVVRHMDRQQKLKYANLLLELGEKENPL